MGRYATPLITSPLLPPVENDVEVLICEARLAHRATNDPEDVEEEQLLTAILSFNPHPAQRYAARNLAGTYIAAQSTFEQLPVGCGLAEWLLELLNSRVAASLNLVVALPADYSDDVARQVEGVLAGLWNDRYHQVGLTVAVCVSPEDWGDCSGIDGFVAAGEADCDQASTHVFNMLAALMAPGLTACIDDEDFRMTFGTHEFPSRVASGVWIEAQATFIWATADDQALAKNCKVISAMPSRCLQLASQHKLMKEICKSTANDSAFVMIAPYGLSSEPLLADQVVPVFLIAAPPAKKMFTS